MEGAIPRIGVKRRPRRPLSPRGREAFAYFVLACVAVVFCFERAAIEANGWSFVYGAIAGSCSCCAWTFWEMFLIEWRRR